jgi:hypothetical protein
MPEQINDYDEIVWVLGLCMEGEPRATLGR